MSETDSPFDPLALREARSLLAAPSATRGAAGLLWAAAFFAVSAMALAVTVVIAPTPWGR